MAHQINEIYEQAQFQLIRLPHIHTPPKIAKIIYVNSGTIMALVSNSIHFIWDEDKSASSSEWTTAPQRGSIIRQWKSSILGLKKTVVPNDTPRDGVVPCFALCGDNERLASASGGAIRAFSMKLRVPLYNILPIHARGPTIPTSIIYHPKDSNIIIIGTEDSFILVHKILEMEDVALKKGHSKRVTGLAITDSGDLLVSTGADARICVWSKGDHEGPRQNAVYLEFPQGTPIPPSDTLVEFHRDQKHILVIHKLQLSQYETRWLARLNQWVVPDCYGYISHATYSCDGKLVYAGFTDGAIRIFNAASLVIKCRIDPNAYLPPSRLSIAHSLVIAAHPERPNQIAVGVAYDGFYVLESHESWEKRDSCLGKRTWEISNDPPRYSRHIGTSTQGGLINIQK
ncbi:protein TOPLESS-like [Silene latifolia]|uniref:protein TOPLESS-like n=1 Tax=Silene latifolia TaxID=37657 RepID=UPI003D788FCE